MGARYGGDIKRRGRGTTWSPRKALEAVGRETRASLWQTRKDEPRQKGRGTTA